MNGAPLQGNQRRVTLDATDEIQEMMQKRGIFFIDSEEIDRDESASFYRDIFCLVASDWKKEDPMWVLLNTPGGHVHHGIAIHDTITLLNASGYNINTVGIGEVASMGTVVIGAGKRRYATPYTQFLLHQVSQEHFYIKEEATQTEERAEEIRRINQIVLNMIAGRTGMPIEELKSLVKKTDYWLGADSALKLGPHGLIDEICNEFPFMDAFVREVPELHF